MAEPTRPLLKAEMERRRHSRVKKNWIYRISGAGAVAIAGWLAVTHTVAFQIRSSNSELAHQIAPYDGRLTALAAAFLSAPEATPASRRQASSVAKLALRQDATTVVAASTLGLNAQVSNEGAAARRFFGYAESLSRRDIQTQLWAIEDAVGRGNVAEALTHYDAAMRSTPSLSQMLFPVLASASTDPQIMGPLINTLRSKPDWGANFISYVSANGADPRSTKSLLVNLRKTGFTVPVSAQSSLINALLTAGFADDAWSYYALNNAGSNPRLSRDPYFVKNAEEASPFDWVLPSTVGVNTSIQRVDQRGLFDFSAPAMMGGIMLQQLQLLPPGSYMLKGHSIGIDQLANARPFWRLSCQSGRELGRVAVPNSSEANGNFAGVLTVSKDCPVQVLSLVAQPSEAVSGVSGQIDFVQLRPAD